MAPDDSLWKWLAGVGGLVVAWLARWAWGKLDSKADRQELRELVERLDQRDVEARESRRAMHSKMDATAMALARLEGEIKGRG